MGAGLGQTRGTPGLRHRSGSPCSPAAEEGSDGQDTDMYAELDTEPGTGLRHGH